MALASRTQVVLTTVGPYALYGSDLVAACVEAGTHYCDLAGEVQWIRKMIDQHQARAQQTGARIVHCCGFDSVPMDIGVWFLQEAAREKYGAYCKPITMLVKATKGAASGGTIASMLNLISATSKKCCIGTISTRGLHRSSWQASIPRWCGAATRLPGFPMAGTFATRKP